MSLLLDARKKSQQAQNVPGDYPEFEFSLEELPNENARSNGRNLFNAKSPMRPAPHTGSRRSWLLVLGGAISLTTVGAGYLWHIDPANNALAPRDVQLPRPVIDAPLTTPAPQPQPLPEAEKTRATRTGAVNTPAPEIAAVNANGGTVHIEQQDADPLLGDAYLAYRSGNLDEAQRLYQEILGKDAQHIDALLGLAAIAQQRGRNTQAVQYYTRVLALDPRNAAANAGMVALSADDGNESRLKTLLNEQNDSAILHFALGNHYAGQSRWGEAQQSYFHSYALEPGNAGFAFNLAVSLDHLGQSELAVQYYRHALQLDEARRAGFDHAQLSQRVHELAR